MCGIAGFWDRRPVRAEQLDSQLTAMRDTLQHRGPDDAGNFVDERAGVALASRRLSVIDLSVGGHQPMTSSDGRLVLVFNGEIYNFVDLRRELEGSGHRFNGSSDTEVLLAAIQKWGLGAALKRCHGMFALAVWDRERRTLRIARDRFGEKPLYFGWSGGVFMFGSELKALRAHSAFRSEIDRDVLALYFRHNCIPAPYSIYRGISQLTPGTIATLEEGMGPGTNPEPGAYWTLREVVDSGRASRTRGTESFDVQAATDELDSVLGTAVRMRMRSDVPLGSFLSGGIDSSLVTALMQSEQSTKVRTFTIAFDAAAYDEADDARRVAEHLGTDHTELLVTSADALSVIESLPAMYDEPFADSSQIPTALLARLTRQHVTVGLSGDGGDEMFGGYNRYLWAEGFWRHVERVPLPLRRVAAAALDAVPPHWWDRTWESAGPVLPKALRVRLPGTKIQKVARALPASSLGDTYVSLSSHFEEPGLIVLGATEPPTLLSSSSAWPPLGATVEMMMYLDSMTYLPDDILTKVDRATMATSLETRLPFLDQDVAELSWRLPTHLKVREGTGKWLLRKLLHRYVPPALVDRPKMGFGIPLETWLRGPLRPWAEELLDRNRLEREGFLSPDPIRKMWSEHISGRRARQYELWDVLMFQAWLAATKG